MSRRTPALLLVLIALLASRSFAIEPAQVAGPWAGKVGDGVASMKIGVEFRADSAGTLSGTCDIPQQGVKGLALESITLGDDDDSISFALSGIPGSPTFTGTLKGDAISGTFKQGAAELPFELKRGRLPARKRSQDPKPPLPYDAEDVRIPVGRGGEGDKAFELAGTITRPKGAGPFPAAILISGSGPQNRDEELLDHRPFLVLADHLTRAGILVLRYDDRGVGESGGQFAGATSEDFARDAEACVAFLKERSEVGPVGLIGHSEGGMIAPLAAARNKDVAFIILMAGIGVSGKELMIRQNELSSLSLGHTEEQARNVAQKADALFNAAIAGKDKDELVRLTKELAAAQQGAAEASALPEHLAQALEAQAGALREPWFLYFLGFDPRPTLRQVSIPVLAINGSVDTQVDARQNLPEIEKALNAGGNKDVTVVELPDLNHLFQHCGENAAWSAGGVQWYASNPETMNPKAMDTVRDWILARFGPGSPTPPK